MSERELHPDLTQRQFLKKLAGTAAGLAGLGMASNLLTPRAAEAAYTAGGAPGGGDLVNTSLSIQGPRPWIDVTAYGAVGDGSTNDTTAVQNAFNALPADGGVVYFPPGAYVLSAQINAPDRHVHVLGAGRGVTTLKWIAYGGLEFHFPNSPYRRLTVQSLSLTSAVSNAAAAIAADWPAWPGGWTNSPHIFDVYIGPYEDPVTHSLSGHWSKGIVLTNASGARIEHFDIHGISGFGMSRGIHLTGDSSITTIRSGFVYIAGRGIDIEGSSEGTYISDVEVVSADMGFVVHSTPAPGSAISNCHAATFQYGIYLFGHGDVAVTGNLLFRTGESTASYVGIYVENSPHCRIIGNNIASLQAVPLEGIVLKAGSNDCTIQGNVIRHLDTGIRIDPGATGNVVTGNRITNPIVAAIVGSTVDNTIGLNR